MRALCASLALASVAAPSAVRAADEPRKAEASSLTARAGVESSGYADSDATYVFTPVLFGEIANPLSGWKVNGSFLVDVVSTASADVVAGASPRWSEVRYAGALAGSKALGDVQATLRGSFSSEPDYLSISGGGMVSVGLLSKNWTPSLAYDFSRDIGGRSGTSFDVFSHTVTKHAFDAGLAVVADAATVFLPMLTAVIEQGDSSKPYRLVPLFRADTELAAGAPAGAQAPRLAKMVERLPSERLRFALTLRVLHRFKVSTLRVDERFYADSWGLRASTTDLRYLDDVAPWLRLGVHLRFHAQSGVAFWRRFYTDTGEPAALTVPVYRTGDRELGPLYAGTLGLSGRVAFGKRFALSPSLDGIYTRFLDTLLIKHRIGALGSATFEVAFE